jgi:hypothetical protein
LPYSAQTRSLRSAHYAISHTKTFKSNVVKPWGSSNIQLPAKFSEKLILSIPCSLYIVQSAPNSLIVITGSRSRSKVFTGAI